MKIGLVLNNFGPSDTAFDFLQSIDSVDRSIDVMGFYLNPARPCIAPRLAICESYLSYSFDGALVATSLATADRVSKAATSKDRYFYVWSPEWLYSTVPFNQLQNLLTSLKVICRTPEIAEHLSEVWNIETKVAKNFTELFKLIGNSNGQQKERSGNQETN